MSKIGKEWGSTLAAAGIIAGLGCCAVTSLVQDKIERVQPTPVVAPIRDQGEPTLTSELSSLPTSEPTSDFPQTETIFNGTYNVRSGDTLSMIAQRLGVSVKALQNENGITNPNVIYAGQTLRIRQQDFSPAPYPVGPCYEIPDGGSVNGTMQAHGIPFGENVITVISALNGEQQYIARDLNAPGASVLVFEGDKVCK